MGASRGSRRCSSVASSSASGSGLAARCGCGLLKSARLAEAWAVVPAWLAWRFLGWLFSAAVLALRAADFLPGLDLAGLDAACRGAGRVAEDRLRLAGAGLWVTAAVSRGASRMRAGCAVSGGDVACHVSGSTATGAECEIWVGDDAGTDTGASTPRFCQAQKPPAPIRTAASAPVPMALVLEEEGKEGSRPSR